MEHIFEIGINVSDEAIKEAAINQLAAKLVKDIHPAIFNKDYRGCVDGFTHSFETDIIKPMIEEYKEEIISRAVDQIVDSIKRSKKYRESLASLGGDSDD